jgi:hypothetical protein
LRMVHLSLQAVNAPSLVAAAYRRNQALINLRAMY